VTPRGSLLPLAVATILALATALSYAGVGSHRYTSYDDPGYAADNAHVRGGLSAEGVRYAFTTFDGGNWNPLTWLSLMLDVELFGDSARAHHRVSLVLHIANALLIFAGLRALTGALWCSALVAALFALHPLHVESVAWISARKDVLSTFFGLLSIGAYVAFAHRTQGKEGSPLAPYVACFLLLALGLMAKPMLVTWPFVFGLLDVWPLRRSEIEAGSGHRTLWPLVREKLPLLALSLIFAVLTVIAQRRSGAVIALEEIPLGARLANAALAYVGYLSSTLWPTGLVPIYPHPSVDVSLPAAGAAALALLGLTALAVRVSRSHRFVIVGWLFYLGTLVPVIGIVQVGSQAMADRYTYVPLIGLFVAMSWSLAAFLEDRPRARLPATGICLSGLLALAWLTHQQMDRWRDDLTLFRYTLDHTDANPVAHIHLAAALQDASRVEEAAAEYRSSLALRPDDPNAWTGLGNTLLRTGHLEEAREAFEKAIGTARDFPEAWIGLGNYFMARRDAAGALRAFQRALELEPASPETHNNVGAALASGGDVRAAIPEFVEAIRLRPGYAEAERNLSAARAVLAHPGDAAR